MKMTSFFHSKVCAFAVALSLATSVQAAYHLMTRSRPHMPLDRVMFPRMSGQSFFSRDVAQVMRGFDEMFDSMTTMKGFKEMFYEPVSMQQRLMSRPSYFLPGNLDASSFALKMPKQTYEIAQDDKQTQIKINLPGIEASDLNLQVDEDNRLLKISGASNREDNGVSVHSSFERSFSLTRDIDTSNISAQMENEVLIITAPKYGGKDSVRRIDIVDSGSKGEGAESVDGVHGAGTPAVAMEEPKKRD